MVNASVATASPPPCNPRRAVLRAEYSLLSIPTPRVMPVGDVNFNFIISSNGRASDIHVVWTRSTWKEWDAAAAKVVESAQFDPPTKPCQQTMRLTFRLQ